MIKRVIRSFLDTANHFPLLILVQVYFVAHGGTVQGKLRDRHIDILAKAFDTAFVFRRWLPVRHDSDIDVSELKKEELITYSDLLYQILYPKEGAGLWSDRLVSQHIRQQGTVLHHIAVVQRTPLIAKHATLG